MGFGRDAAARPGRPARQRPGAAADGRRLIPDRPECKEYSPMATVSVRYIVHDIEAAIGFYTRHLGFSVQIHPNEMFAMLNRGDLRLVLSVPGAPAGGGQAMPDG